MLRRDVARRIELERADAKVPVAGLHGPPEQRPHARGELTELERLHEVVVGPVVEPADPVVEARARRQHQDARLRAAVALPAGPQAPADLPPVEPRQVEIEADHVVGVRARLHERVVAGVRDVDRVALVPQAASDRRREILLVLDHQHTHRPNHCNAIASISLSGLYPTGG